MIPELFNIGPFSVNSFGLMMVCCFMSAWRLLYLRLKGAGYNPEHAESMVFWAALGGIFGARLLYILANFNGFLADPTSYIFTAAGFVFYGGLIGGFLAVVFYLRKHSLPFFKMADLVAPSLALGYGVGRIGCHLAGDGDYGGPTNLPWSFSYNLGVVATEPGVMVHPSPVYESVAALLIAVLLVKLASKWTKTNPGRLFGLYLILMSVERFLVEFVRVEPKVLFGLSQAQVIAPFLLAFGLFFFYRRNKLV